MFERLRAIYPHFAKHINTPTLRNMVREWGEALVPYSAKTIAEAVLVFRVNHPYAPNSVAEFIGVCKTIRSRELAMQAFADSERARERARPRTQQELQRGREHVAQIKKIALQARISGSGS